MSTMTKPRLFAAVAVSSAALVGGMTLPSAHAAGNSYVALGDSYSAGVGAKSRVDSACYRSTLGYPPLIAAAKGLALNYQACSGATTSDVATKQIGALNTGTNYVTMTIGGNDVGFADVLVECAKPSWMSNCQGKINTGLAILRGQLPARYDSLFGSIRNKAPNAKVAIGTYPRIFNGEDCNALTWFSPSEQSALNTATDELDTLVLNKAGSFGFGKVDVRGAFNTHRVCDNVEWINGLSWPVDESYHPNRSGHQAYATAFSSSILGSALALPTTGAMKQSTAQKATAARNAAAKIDLLSPQSLKGAAKVGIPVSELKRLQAALRSGDLARINAADVRIKQLDAMASAKLRAQR